MAEYGSTRSFILSFFHKKGTSNWWWGSVNVPGVISWAKQLLLANSESKITGMDWINDLANIFFDGKASREMQSITRHLYDIYMSNAKIQLFIPFSDGAYIYKNITSI
jgi:hypothetical protein